MNKKIWLSVIKEELGFLDKLATAMAEDQHLTKMEVELAVSRAGMVTKVFEMLLKQVPVQEIPETRNEEVAVVVEEPVTPSKAEPAPVTDAREVAAKPLLEEVSAPASPPVPPSPSLQIPQPNSPSVAGPPQPAEATEPPLPPVLRQEQVEPPKPHFTRIGKEESVDLEVKMEEPSRYKPTPIKSLKEGLNLNDRYLFQRELFNNDKFRLDETIVALDRLGNIQEAVAYLKANFKWVKSEASERFVQLVKRRFSE